MKRPHQPVRDILAGPKKSTAAMPAPSEPTPAAAAHRPPGRPPGPESSSKITVVFYDRQTRSLDDLCHAIYGKTRSKITRTEIIRGMLDAVLSSGISLDDVTSESDVRQRIAARLKGKAQS